MRGVFIRDTGRLGLGIEVGVWVAIENCGIGLG